MADKVKKYVQTFPLLLCSLSYSTARAKKLGQRSKHRTDWPARLFMQNQLLPVQSMQIIFGLVTVPPPPRPVQAYPEHVCSLQPSLLTPWCPLGHECCSGCVLLGMDWPPPRSPSQTKTYRTLQTRAFCAGQKKNPAALTLLRWGARTNKGKIRIANAFGSTSVKSWQSLLRLLTACHGRRH